MEPEDLLRFVVIVCEQLSLRYLVTGSTATIAYDSPPVSPPPTTASPESESPPDETDATPQIDPAHAPVPPQSRHAFVQP